MKNAEPSEISQESARSESASSGSSEKVDPEQLKAKAEHSLEQQRLEIERGKLAIEAEKLQLERSKERTARRLGTLPTIVSLFAVVLTGFTTYQNSALISQLEDDKRHVERERMEVEQQHDRRIEVFKKLLERTKSREEVMQLYGEFFPSDALSTAKGIQNEAQSSKPRNR